MREVIAVCRSEKHSRDRVARILDRYFWRIGDRTWRGKATNACLDRVSKELRMRATRNTAVVIHEIRSSSESRKPIIQIGKRHAFSETGLVPVSSHAADFRNRASRGGDLDVGASIVSIAALFHDLGKATNLFQNKLRRALKGERHEADAIRHELFSAAVWDHLFGKVNDDELANFATALTPEMIDQACVTVCDKLKKILRNPENDLNFDFVRRVGTISHLIGMIILTHHLLPDGEANHERLIGHRHISKEGALQTDKDLEIAAGVPFWHEVWWLNSLQESARKLRPVFHASADIALRASLMFADHLGSAKKSVSAQIPHHLGNTTTQTGQAGFVPADSLSRHVQRVHRYTRFAHEILYRLRDRYPAIDASALPKDIAFPEISANARYAWQGQAAHAARQMCANHEGGFFAAILAGTGTGKTRAAPTILAAAAMADKITERRYFRMSLALGLRVLATQSAKEYIDDLGFAAKDVSVLIGEPPLRFQNPADDDSAIETQGSESLITLPDWLRVEAAEGHIPENGSDAEATWLQGLSLDTDRGLPAFLELVLEHSGKSQASGKRLLQAPIMVGTIDHLMSVAAPTRSRFLLPALRVMTSDLILDEIDQYDGEDLAAIGRLIFQAGAAGRRVVIMSATLTPDIADALHHAYCNGWHDHAIATGIANHVNLLLCGDAPGSVFTNENGTSLTDLMNQCRDKILQGLRAAKPIRRAEILPPSDTWQDLVVGIDNGCTRLHNLNAVDIDGYRVSVGLVRMTRISHTTAIAFQLRSGNLGDRLRLLICLHSQMPRLHRGFIEAQLKLALTRKDKNNPNRGVKSLCNAHNVFSRANDLGLREIEIVVVTTPVIETGNDVDFDWAILDPISTRSIIQSAGRVCRHRQPCGDHPNVLILGRSPVAMQQGALAMPGVETKLAAETGVAKADPLRGFDGRHFTDLAGQADFRTISAEPVLRDDLVFPLRDAEADLRKRMISTLARDPLGKYISSPNVRWNLAMTRSRKFRRSDTREIEFKKLGDTIDEAKWYVDLAPGSRESKLRDADGDLYLDLPKQPDQLFQYLTTSGWHQLAGEIIDMPSSAIRELFRVKIASYGDDLGTAFTYTDFTGFTRGTPEALFEPFGKSK